MKDAEPRTEEIRPPAAFRPERSLRTFIAALVAAIALYTVAVAIYLLTTVRAVPTTALILAGGGVVLPFALLLLRRRLWAPLARLERGLQQVADGDLTTQVPIVRNDELGRLGAHFNEMTRVLRGRAEEQGRYAAAGELLAGVAHEVNNPLMAIASHAELRLADTQLPPDQRAEMQSILRQTQRAAKLLRGLLRFLRAGETRTARVNLNDVARSAIDLVSYRFRLDEITIGGTLDPALPPVDGDAIRLEQVVVNLLSNALDALRMVNPPRLLTVDSFVRDGQACIAVTDNGPGVAPEIAGRLFRPFATTKGRRGTGLGLYVSRQIVRDAGGEIHLLSGPDAPARGSRFVATVPVAPAPAAVEPAAARPPSPPSPPPAAPSTKPSLAGIRILLVDDEELIRRPIARFLGKRSAQVTEAEDGLAALERLQGRESNPDVILVDLRMPRMDGPALYARLQVDHPELAARVLFLSGDITQLASQGLAEVPRDRVLVKPVELLELEQRIREFAAERLSSSTPAPPPPPPAPA